MSSKRLQSEIYDIRCRYPTSTYSTVKCKVQDGCQVRVSLKHKLNIRRGKLYE